MSRTSSDAPTRTARVAFAYFALVFGAGFILGSIRIPFLVPRLGERVAELIEMPFMFVVIVLAARFIVKRFALPTAIPVRLSVGSIALALLLIAEVLLNVALQSQTLGAYIASRDPVSGSVYLAMLVLFALMPLVLARVHLVLARVRLVLARVRQRRDMDHQSIIQGNDLRQSGTPDQH